MSDEVLILSMKKRQMNQWLERPTCIRNGPETIHTSCKPQKVVAGIGKQVDVVHRQFGPLLLQGRRPPGYVGPVATRKMVAHKTPPEPIKRHVSF